MGLKQITCFTKILIVCISRNKHWNTLNSVGYVGSNLLQAKNDYDDGDIFFGLFLAPKTKYCLTINEFGVMRNIKLLKDLALLIDYWIQRSILRCKKVNR